MNIKVRISFLWLSISVCFLLHSVYHLSELFFGIDIKTPEANGTVPVAAHLFRIVVELGVLIMFLLSLYAKSKSYYVFSYVWAVLLGILNVVHLGGTIVSEFQEYSQLTLLAFIVVVNIFLIIDSNKCWRELRRADSNE